MPIFEYKCSKCGHTMEALERHYGERKHICERCGSSQMQKLFSGFSVGQTDQPSSSPGRESLPA